MDSNGGAQVGVTISTPEDVWNIYNLIVPGDAVLAKTHRKVNRETSMGAGGSERRALTLCIRVVIIEFDSTNGEIRLNGLNETESEYVKLGSHHTLAIAAGDPQDITLIKKVWDGPADDQLQAALDATERDSDTAAVIMDYGLASVCIITPSMVMTKARVTTGIAKKSRNNRSSRDECVNVFFKAVLEAMINNIKWDTVRVVLICSPSTIRDDFVAFMKTTVSTSDGSATNDRAIVLKQIGRSFDKIVSVRVSTGYKSALRDALCQRDVVERMQNTKAAQSTEAWENFLRTMTRDSQKCTYTSQFVYTAVSSGAVETLFVADSVLHTSNFAMRHFYVGMMEVVKQYGGSALVLSSMMSSGTHLEQLGGVAAILRYPLPELEDLEVDPSFPPATLLKEMHDASKSTSATRVGSSSMEWSRSLSA